MMELKDARVLVVGGSSGIGLATARAFAAEHAHVTISSRSEARVKEAVADISGQVDGCVMDVSSDESVDEFFRTAGTFDHVVVTATARPGAMDRADTLPIDDAYRAMNTKFWGAYRVARQVRLEPGGSLALVSGILAQRPGRSSALQCAINSALEGLSRALSVELAPARVNVISPGVLSNAPMLAEKSEAERAEFERHLPLGRAGTPDHVADAILFAARNTYTTGATIRVDGGSAIAP